jgi:hypothetical protein
MPAWVELAAVGGLVVQFIAAVAYVLRLEGRLNVHGEKFETVKAQFAAVDHRFIALEGALKRIEDKLDRLIERRTTSE